MHDQDTVRIPLRAKDGSVRAYALIDTADAIFVNQWRWYSNGLYAARGGKTSDGRPTTCYLHRQLLGLQIGDGLEVDHINRDKLDCRRANMRVVPEGSQPQNTPGSLSGTSRYRGVYWDRDTGRWRAEVQFRGRRYKLGRFTEEQAAAEATRRLRLELMPYAVD